MRNLAGVAVLVLTVPTLAVAQDARGQCMPYVFAAPGGVSASVGTLHIGAGVDAPFWKGVGVSLEGGYIGSFANGFNGGIGLVSMNGVYHAGVSGRHLLDPFVTGGFSWGFTQTSGGAAINIGGGMNYWLTDGTGLRIEFRDHVPVDRGITNVHLWGIRFGLTWSR